MKNILSILVALMMIAPIGGVYAEEVNPEAELPVAEETVQEIAEEEAKEETEEDKKEKKEKDNKQSDKEEIVEEEQEQEKEKKKEKPEKDTGKNNKKFSKDDLDAHKKERKENRIEAREFMRLLKEGFANADPETKKAILEELGIVKKELKLDSIGLFVKGKHVDFEKYDNVEPVIENNRTLIPLRAAAETLEADVLWKAEDRSITLFKDETEIILKIDNSIAIVNGEKVELDCPPKIKKERTLVPIRFLSEAFGLEVEWDENSKTIVAE